MCSSFHLPVGHLYVCTPPPPQNRWNSLMVELYRWDLWLYDFLTPKLFPVKMLQIFPWYFWGGWAWRKWCEWIFNLCPFPFQRVFFFFVSENLLFSWRRKKGLCGPAMQPATGAGVGVTHGGSGDLFFLFFCPPAPLRNSTFRKLKAEPAEFLTVPLQTSRCSI